MFTERETAALEAWRSLLEEGGANIKTTDHVDAVRYAKVSMVSASSSWYGQTDYQNIWNATWSSIQALSRTYPSTYAALPAATVAPIKKMIREIVDVGFEAGLLREGDPQYNLGGKGMSSRQELADQCWEIVSIPPRCRVWLG